MGYNRGSQMERVERLAQMERTGRLDQISQTTDKNRRSNYQIVE